MKAENGMEAQQEDLQILWGELFTEKRGSGCRTGGGQEDKTAAQEPVLLTDVKVQDNVRQSSKADSSWLKKWGYGEAAYFFDFLDPVFQKDFVTAFKKLYKDASDVSNKDTEKFQDPFDIKKLVANKKNNITDYRTVNKNYDQAIYDKAINSVQLNEVMKKWNWLINPGEADYAVNFIARFDLDGDGRLNPRELALGAIIHNKDIISTTTCQNCFQEIAFKLDAMFVYLDCNTDGYLSAEDMWYALPKLNRPESKWNIFAIKNNDNVRTSAINDFVIKNHASKEGSLSKEEYRGGITLGFWDRQTKETGIVEDDSRNLKVLRWNKTGMTDTVAFNYLQEKSLAEMIAKSGK